MSRECRKCNDVKDNSEFTSLKNGKLDPYCTVCRRKIALLAYRKKCGLSEDLDFVYKKHGVKNTFSCKFCNNNHACYSAYARHCRTEKHKRIASAEMANSVNTNIDNN